MIKRDPFKYFYNSPEIIRLAVIMYVRFPLSLRNFEDLLHERGIGISHETVRYWWNRFGSMFAAEIRRKRVQQMRASSNWRWHLDEVFVKINGERHSLWRAVDHEGEVLESFVAKRRDRKAALKVLKTSMKRHGRPHTLVTDKLRSYGAAMKVVGNANRQDTGRWENNRAENAHPLPDSGLLANHEKGPFRRRERAMQRFRSMRCLQKLAAVHAAVYTHFNQQRALYSRDNFKANRAAALAEWRDLGAA
jgi:putative transposase